MSGFWPVVRRVTRDPRLNILVGLIFCFSAAIELMDALLPQALSGIVRVHHGAIIFGFFHALKNLPDVFEGIEYLEIGAGAEDD